MSGPSPRVSVIVPAYNEPGAALAGLHDSLLAQSLGDFEVIIVDDGSPAPDYSAIRDPRFRVLVQAQNGGPAKARNRGAAAARGALLFFTDADCRLPPDCLAAVAALPADETIAMGNTITEARTFWGRAIAYLGFPGGGLIGFDRVWPVDAQGHTNSITSCNLVIRRETFAQLGGFDESFPVPAGEDTLLARAALDAGLRIRYQPEQVVLHGERSGLAEFCRWQITRGRGTWHVRRRLGAIGGYAGQRLRGLARSFGVAPLHYAPALALLVGLMLLCTAIGYRQERARQAQ